ncbi:HlyD family secretion protein [Pseudoxanthomonas indica]|uniref:HlyD family secretion protein n=1 Tax=Pseudoxanthomonas indica TaxID=428993 RepID=A0A1T5JJ92_9GAMM|nr:HlyD family efflux transporter periplasmic adaptor subunit [Pseudoxanthomonas indica]GGD58912.1 membrane protein [Pseudoxanthomonas indica]SKC51288.1 HlyD family secretion protein [Pseudoxanthomonas indica]
MRTDLRWALALAPLLIVGCADKTPRALGTLEWDRITLPAPAAEKITRIDVREGQQVAAGAPLLQLELTRTQSQLASSQAQAQQSREVLDELRAGPRREAIAQARATLASAQAQALDTRAYYNRLLPLGRQQLVAASEVDRARAAADNAGGQVRAAQAALLELENGTRVEQLAQGQSAVAAAEAQASVQAVTLEKLSVVAPRAGRIDSLPYKLGDQAPVGAPLAVMLVGDAPYARVYVPETQRTYVKVGDQLRVRVDGRDQVYNGRVRMIRSEPSFTPYYALSGKDAARLSYIAEVSLLDKDAAQLPAGVPVSVELAHGQP